MDGAMVSMVSMRTMQNPSEQAAAQAAQIRGAAEEAAQAARNAAEQARDIARAQREAAQAQADAARIQGQAENGGPVVTVTTSDGRTITLTDASPEAVAVAMGQPLPQRDDDAAYAVGGLSIVTGGAVLITAIVLWYRATIRGVTAKGAAALPADLTQRLQRMEAGIESVAVEVERISEGQRFTTRLLSDRAVEEVRRG